MVGNIYLKTGAQFHMQYMAFEFFTKEYRNAKHNGLCTFIWCLYRVSFATQFKTEAPMHKCPETFETVQEWIYRLYKTDYAS